MARYISRRLVQHSPKATTEAPGAKDRVEDGTASPSSCFPRGTSVPENIKSNPLIRGFSSEYSFHSLRHSYSTWLNEAGFSETDRMRIVGHADKKVSQKYTHAQIETVQENLKRLKL
ncbi:hypothetical protein DDZ13_08050 [Coraliomargarita sinensis]|uniref:Tyr recombinase domain-containing protein n=1 Tax=Coraliomargarita sinensis TaxID=2174842 RepID=A0A317ZJN8_9BACT|nr:hypothetical protein DDZ13_08050 [Coraliomargarita sinensis]